MIDVKITKLSLWLDTISFWPILPNSKWKSYCIGSQSRMKHYPWLDFFFNPKTFINQTKKHFLSCLYFLLVKEREKYWKPNKNYKMSSLNSSIQVANWDTSKWHHSSPTMKVDKLLISTQKFPKSFQWSKPIFFIPFGSPSFSLTSLAPSHFDQACFWWNTFL